VPVALHIALDSPKFAIYVSDLEVNRASGGVFYSWRGIVGYTRLYLGFVHRLRRARAGEG